MISPIQYYNIYDFEGMKLRSGTTINCMTSSNYYKQIENFVRNDRKGRLITYCNHSCQLITTFIYITKTYKHDLHGGKDGKKSTNGLFTLKKLYYIHRDKIDYFLREIEQENIHDENHELYYCKCVKTFENELLELKKWFKKPHITDMETYFDLATGLNKDVAGMIIDRVCEISGKS